VSSGNVPGISAASRALVYLNRSKQLVVIRAEPDDLLGTSSASASAAGAQADAKVLRLRALPVALVLTYSFLRPCWRRPSTRSGLLR
jgi:hypothetical protein